MKYRNLQLSKTKIYSYFSFEKRCRVSLIFELRSVRGSVDKALAYFFSTSLQPPMEFGYRWSKFFLVARQSERHSDVALAQIEL